MKKGHAQIQKRSLKSSFAWVFVGNIAFAASQFLLITLIARSFGDMTLGNLALCLSIVSPILVVTGMQLRGMLATDFLDSFTFAHYLGVRLATLLIVPVTAAVTAVVLKFDHERLSIISAVVVMKMIEGLPDIYYGLFQRTDHMDRIGIARMLRGASLALLTLLGVFVWGDLVALLWGTCLLWLAVFAFYEVPQAIRFGATFPSLLPVRQAFTLFRTALPMAGVVFLNAFSAQLPIYFLVGYWGTKMLGQYTAVAQFILALTLLTGPMSQVSAPRIAAYLHQDAKAFWVLFWKLQAVAALLGLTAMAGALLLGNWVLSTILSPEYGSYYKLLALLSLTIGIQQADAFTGVAVTASRIFKCQLFVRIGTTLAILFAGWFLIRDMGMWAMPWVLMIPPAISILIYLPILRTEVRRRHPTVL